MLNRIIKTFIYLTINKKYDMKIKYLNSCPICSGDVLDSELVKFGKCKKCYEENKKDELELIEEKVKEFEIFFENMFGYKLTKMQRSWLRKFFKNKSFSIVAPTGIGKTTFGIILSIYLALKGKKVHFLTLTSVLVHHIYQKFLSFIQKNNFNLDIACYSTQLKESEKVSNLEKIKNKNYSILITTNKFLTNKLDLIKDEKFDLIFIDDVDSFLKSSKYVEIALNLRGDNGIIIVSGATTRSRRTRAVKLLKEKLGFEVGFRQETIRNIDEYFLESNKVEENVIKIIKEFGGGCLIFVPSSKGLEYAKELNEELSKNGIRSAVFESNKKRLLNKFESGEIDVLIGVASYKSPIARGIDLPERIRYVIFAGVPRQEIKLKYEKNPIQVLILLKNIQEFIENNYLRAKIQRYIESLSKIYLKFLYENYIDEKLMNEIDTFLKEILTEELLKKIENSETASIESRNGELYLIISDPIGYIQASGRCSRLYAGGILKGVSILILDNFKAFNDLKAKLKYIIEEIEFKNFDENEVKKSFEIVNQDREKLRKIKEGKVKLESVEFFDTALIIVESPTKARTISRFFTLPSRRTINNITFFESIIGKYIAIVVPTGGHIFELSNKGELFGIDFIENKFIPNFGHIKICSNCGENFIDEEVCPSCNSSKFFNKKSIINVIRELSVEVDNVFIATDFDSEGEKIAYDIFCNISGLSKNVKRLEIHEITRTALLKALNNPLEVNEKLVEAQLVRRIEDRLVGYSLSQKLQKELNKKTLSAGRVQSPVLKWIIERSREFSKKKKVLEVTLENNLKLNFELGNEISGDKVFIKTNSFEEKIGAQPPYSTDTFLKDCNNILKLTSSEAMRIAQDLFEAGLITYIRTDSTTVSDVGINVAREYFSKKKLEDIFEPKKYFKEGAHECIRPTRALDIHELRQLINLKILRIPINLTPQHFNVYDLIFRRFMASQSKSCLVEKQKIEAELNGLKSILERIVEIKYEGFSKFLPIKKYEKIEDGEYKIMEKRIVGIPLKWLFEEGEIIEKMKIERIGRPSTYSTIIKKLFDRRYIRRIKVGLIPTRIGKEVFNYLFSNFSKFVSESRTRELEENMDKVERGEIDYQDVIKDVYIELKNNNLL